MWYGKAIKQARTKLGLTQTELADMMGLTTTAICAWETGRICPAAKNQKKLNETLGIDFKLFDGGRPSHKFREEYLTKRYAVYKGEKILATGTAWECAKDLGIKPETVRVYAAPSRRKGASENTTIAIVLED